MPMFKRACVVLLVKTLRIYLIALLLFAATVACNAQAQTTANKVHDYITIMVNGKEADEIYVSYNGEKYEKIKREAKANGDYDYNEVIKLINSFEKEGYGLFSNGFEHRAPNTDPTNYFLLRRERKN